LTFTARTTLGLVALAAGSTLAVAGSGGSALAATDQHHASSAVAPGTNSVLLGIALAPKSSDAWALVNTTKPAAVQSSFTVAHRHKNHWSRLAVASRPNSVVDLRGIAAGSTKQVWAAGETVSPASVDTPLLERSRGGAFKVVAVKGLTSGSHLAAVAASSPKDAWAMGIRDDDTASFTLHWNGKKWKKSPLVIAGSAFTTYGVSTVNAKDAWAVGFAASSNRIIHWNGKKWSISDTLPADESLGDIAASGAHVWAVGSGPGAHGEVPLALRLSHSRWRTVPLKHSPTGYFQAVSAVGSTAYAVGRNQPATPGTPQSPIFAKLHGTKGGYGSIKKKGKSSAIYDVAASTKAVIAVGTFTPGAQCDTPNNPLAEVYVHNAWKLAAIPASVAPASSTGEGICD
jgi:hypothetical protein